MSTEWSPGVVSQDGAMVREHEAHCEITTQTYAPPSTERISQIFVLILRLRKNFVYSASGRDSLDTRSSWRLSVSQPPRLWQTGSASLWLNPKRDKSATSRRRQGAAGVALRDAEAGSWSWGQRETAQSTGQGGGDSCMANRSPSLKPSPTRPSGCPDLPLVVFWPSGN